ncbi:30S ribosomal protein S4 [Candidatus Nomurabacteria bacterium]|nr:30S ribosomal protein S4 [Candidatus Nomurabacteria bacterium]
MKIGPKYKIARRLGAAVFEKTQTPKFVLSAQKKKTKGFQKQRTGYAAQVLEKQKVRFTYFISEKQLANYVKAAIFKNPSSAGPELFSSLEKRLDSVVLRSGFAKTRFASRQAVAHGHFMVNGRRSNVPSYQLKVGDVITIREGSKQKGLFAELEERLTESSSPTWLSVDKSKKSITLKGEPVYSAPESHFDINSVIQFYKR